MNYTKGEWKYTEELKANCSMISNGNEIICGLFNPVSGYEDDLIRMRANAHLISAAPDMYEALKECESWLNAFVMKFYTQAEKPTYENMKQLYIELNNFVKQFGSKALNKAEGKE